MINKTDNDLTYKACSESDTKLTTKPITDQRNISSTMTKKAYSTTYPLKTYIKWQGVF
jgi:hypothetical protein